MFLEIIISIIGAFLLYVLMRINGVNSNVRFQREALEYKLIGESGKLLVEINDLKNKLDKIDAALVLVLDDISHRNLKTNTKQVFFPPANRTPRTEEQRRLAAEKKKAWWAAKRAEEELKKNQTSPLSSTLTINAS